MFPSVEVALHFHPNLGVLITNAKSKTWLTFVRIRKYTRDVITKFSALPAIKLNCKPFFLLRTALEKSVEGNSFQSQIAYELYILQFRV